MDERKYQAILTVVDLGSFTAAAEALNYSQSGITRLIASVEAELGFPLFIRRKKGVELTPNGQILLPLFRESLQLKQKITEITANIHGLQEGRLIIGSYFSIASIWLPSILKQFKEKYPNIHIVIKEGGNQELITWLNEKSIDLCLCAKPQNTLTYDWIPLYRDRLLAWLPPHHPLAKAKQVPLTIIEEEAFIQTSKNQDTDQDRLIQIYNLTPRIQYHTKDAFTTYSMVQAGLGISFNQELITTNWHGQVALVPFEPAQAIELGIAILNKDEASPATRKFIDEVIHFTKDLPHS